jgi:hypothetical protein
MGRESLRSWLRFGFRGVGDGGLVFDEGGFAAEHTCWALAVEALERYSCVMVRSLNLFVHMRCKDRYTVNMMYNWPLQ